MLQLTMPLFVKIKSFVTLINHSWFRLSSHQWTDFNSILLIFELLFIKSNSIVTLTNRNSSWPSFPIIATRNSLFFLDVSTILLKTKAQKSLNTIMFLIRLKITFPTLKCSCKYNVVRIVEFSKFL